MFSVGFLQFYIRCLPTGRSVAVSSPGYQATKWVWLFQSSLCSHTPLVQPPRAFNIREETEGVTRDWGWEEGKYTKHSKGFWEMSLLSCSEGRLQKKHKLQRNHHREMNKSKACHLRLIFGGLLDNPFKTMWSVGLKPLDQASIMVILLK